jgi:hypothetical protein
VITFFLGALFTLVPGPLDGTFITIDQCRDPRIWEAEFRLMDMAGLDTIIVRETADMTMKDAFYPTQQPGMVSDCPYDRVGMILALAERYDMEVYLGLVFGSGTSSPNPGELRETMLYASAWTARELTERYGDYPAFTGWYLTPEAVANDWVFRRDHYRIQFHYDLVMAIRAVDGRPIASAPYVIPNSTWQPVSIEQMREFSQNYVLQTGVNILILQDGAGASNRSLDDIGMIFEAASAGIAGTGAQIWADIEAFRVQSDGRYVSAGAPAVMAQSERVEPVVEKTVTWTFQHYMSPFSGNPGAWSAFLAYMTRISPN